jgi:hypothetical protein
MIENLEIFVIILWYFITIIHDDKFSYLLPVVAIGQIRWHTFFLILDLIALVAMAIWVSLLIIERRFRIRMSLGRKIIGLLLIYPLVMVCGSYLDLVARW